MQGRILILQAQMGKLRVVAEKDVRGGAMVLQQFQVCFSCQDCAARCQLNWHHDLTILLSEWTDPHWVAV